MSADWASRLHALHELAVAAGGVLEPEVLARLAADKANQLLGGSGAGLQIWDSNDEVLRILAQTGTQPWEIPPMKSGEGAGGIAFETRRPLPIADYVAWNGGVQWVKDLGLKSFLAVPLLVQGRAIGCLTVAFQESHEFSTAEIELISLLAAQVAPAMEAARLYSSMQAANRQWRHILATSPQAVLMMTLDGVVTSANRTALRLLGYQTEEMILGRTHRELVRYGDGEPEDRVAELRSAVEPYYKLQRRAVRCDGSEFWADITVVLVRHDTGRPAFFYIIFEDIDERLAAIEELARSRERIELIVGNAPIVLFATDAAGVVTLSEGHGLEKMGRKPGDMVGVSLRDLYHDHPELLAGLESGLRGESGGQVIQLPDLDVVLDVRYTPMRDEDGTARGVIGVAVDITEQRRTEREREETEVKLRQSYQVLRQRGRERRRLLASLVTVQEEERRRIAAGIHDDTLQVLANLGFHLERLRRRSEARGADTDVLDHLDQSLQMAVDRLRRLVFDLRSMSLDQEGLVAALRQLVEDMGRETGMAVEQTGAILSEPEGEARVALYRIAREAIVNVRKHSGARHCELSIEEIDGWYRVIVRDDGRGFDTSAATEPGHIGLISMNERRILVGGRMEVVSSPGNGTTVSVWLPGRAGAAREGEADA